MNKKDEEDVRNLTKLVLEVLKDKRFDVATLALTTVLSNIVTNNVDDEDFETFIDITKRILVRARQAKPPTLTIVT